VVVSGVLSASPASGATVALWRERAGQSSFQQLAQTTTNGSGAYTFTLKPGTVLADQAFYVTSGSLQSSTLDQHVRALVGLVTSHRTMAAGQRVVLRGHVTPSHAGESVLIEQFHGGAWHVIALARLSKRSSYTFSHRFRQAGRARLRAVLQSDARNVQSISPALTITVTS
jgi:serine protease